MTDIMERPWDKAAAIDQDYLDTCQNHQEFSLRIVCQVELDRGWARVSDRYQYVGLDFYEARAKLPTITRKVGEFLHPGAEFSTVRLEIGNVDGKYTWESGSGVLGKEVLIDLGLGEKKESYRPLFRGRVTDAMGVEKTRDHVTLVARDLFDRLRQDFPPRVFTKKDYPAMEDTGGRIPAIFGSFEEAPILGLITNGLTLKENPDAYIEVTTSDHDLSRVSRIEIHRAGRVGELAPSNFKRVGAGRYRFSKEDVKTASGQSYTFSLGDKIHIYGKGLDIAGEKLLDHAQLLLMLYGGMEKEDFDANWEEFRGKLSPEGSATGKITGAVLADKKHSLLSYVQSILMQLRLEMFISKDLKLKLLPLHFDTFAQNIRHRITNADVERGSVRVLLDSRHSFTTAQGFYRYSPAAGGTTAATDPIGIKDKEEGSLKAIDLPNLTTEAHARQAVQEILRLSAMAREYVELTLTPRSLLLDIGDWVEVSLHAGGVRLDNVPMMVRSVSITPKMQVKVVLWHLRGLAKWRPTFE